MTRRYQIPQQQQIQTPPQNPTFYQQSQIPQNPQQNAFIGGYSQQNQKQPIFPWNNPKILKPDPSPNMPERPPYFRTTANLFPATKEILNNLGIPISVIVSPAQVTDVPIIDKSNVRLTRCRNCFSYLSPFHKNVNSTTITCPFCGSQMQLSMDEYNAMQMGPEIRVPVYDMIAPPVFKNLPDSGPSFCFIFDVTLDAMQSGFTPQMITSCKATLPSIQDDTRIAIITTSDAISFFNFKDQTQVIVPDLTDVICPNDCVATLGDVREVVDAYLDYLLTLTGPKARNCLISALEAAQIAMEGRGAVIVAGSFGIPGSGPIALQPRYVGGDIKEADLLKMANGEATEKIKKISRSLNHHGCSVHLFISPCGREPVDLGTISVPSGLTGGHCHLYTDLNERTFLDMHTDLYKTLTQEYFWDSSMRLRATKGILVKNSIGNLIVSNETVFFPIMQSSSTVTYDLIIDGDIPPTGILLQLAILWTNSLRQRMIRIFSFNIPVSSDINQISEGIDEGAIATMLVKYASNNLLRSGAEQSQQILRNFLQSMASKGRRFSSLYYFAHSLLCSDILKVQIPRGADGRMATIIGIRACNLNDALLKLYPRFFALENVDEMLPLTQSSFANGTVFIVHTHNSIYIWVSPAASIETLNSVFGVNSVEELPTSLPQTGTELSNRLLEAINQCYIFSGRYLPIEIIPPQSERETIFTQLLVDDDTSCGANVTNFISSFPH